MAVMCMAGQILETELLDFFSCLCGKVLISYLSRNVIILMTLSKSGFVLISVSFTMSKFPSVLMVWLMKLVGIL